jgi:anti-sigma factor RsiW
MVRGEGCRLFDTHGNEVGARLDSIHNRVVAALVFKHDQHVINLFVWPVADLKDSGPTSTTREGFNLLHWTCPA